MAWGTDSSADPAPPSPASRSAYSIIESHPSCKSPPRSPAIRDPARRPTGWTAGLPTRQPRQPKEAVVDESLVLDNLADAADVGGAGGAVGVDDAEPEIGLQQCVHHDSVAELEDLQREDGAGEEDEWEGEQGELDGVVGLGGGGVAVVLLRGGGGGAAEGGRVVPPVVAAAEGSGGRRRIVEFYMKIQHSFFLLGAKSS
ncbi:hypothetical protein RJ640_020902 [Escallonia rubra]|uniref:Uncharacterized protein n=1 Tax=Escallonia rubra TaxID=112253 RepID=A0AA88QVP1_9ASTE|nr:hypothetical protein RJ640_020902 [Escallonia rubra]